jgi:hypothetical protein
MPSRFDYVKYDDRATVAQAEMKAKFQDLEDSLNRLLPAPRVHDSFGRAKALVLTKLEEAYMWVGKAIRDAMSLEETKDLAYWERNVLALRYAEGWYNDDLLDDGFTANGEYITHKTPRYPGLAPSSLSRRRQDHFPHPRRLRCWHAASDRSQLGRPYDPSEVGHDPWRSGGKMTTDSLLESLRRSLPTLCIDFRLAPEHDDVELVVSLKTGPESAVVSRERIPREVITCGAPKSDVEGYFARHADTLVREVMRTYLSPPKTPKSPILRGPN